MCPCCARPPLDAHKTMDQGRSNAHHIIAREFTMETEIVRVEVFSFVHYSKEFFFTLSIIQIGCLRRQSLHHHHQQLPHGSQDQFPCVHQLLARFSLLSFVENERDFILVKSSSWHHSILPDNKRIIHARSPASNIVL